MRVLFVTNPEKSIFQYLAPHAWALRTAGHEVVVASQPRFADVITQAGLTAVPVGRDRDPWRLVEWKPDLHDALRVGVLRPYDAAMEPELATWEYLRSGYEDAVTWWHRLNNVPVIAGLVDFARQWKPDLVIWEPLAFAGSIAAKACGAAHARLLFSLDIFGVTRENYLRLTHQQPPEDRADPLADWLERNANAYGAEFSEDLATGGFTIDQFPPSLQMYGAGLSYVNTQYIPYGGPAVVPGWLREPPRRPRVAFTMGLSATERFDGYSIDVRDVLLELSTLDIEVVATVAEEQRPRLGELPDNVRTVPYVPMHALIPTCSAVIHHAGAATLATTCRYGVPQLAVHLHFDQPELARRLARHGAGLSLANDEATGRSIREATERLLGEPTFSDRAADLREEFLALPSPNDLVARLEELTADHRAAAPALAG
ncbi:activator-dependent family glycosyltransferase [Prauserella cavernicola]|uniref:Activator-dependent family glycosyltransferase n=1 Tax=Prauserella cavernicola TaxID=2800127 RepID=A0A934V7M5_9PSEU|nr:activator-dependent family glycosyltransferase [Prauserella cavernicola]MBK1787854.1 activator-dependent family glycosyltransferase [Prauserella cavernicola]